MRSCQVRNTCKVFFYQVPFVRTSPPSDARATNFYARSFDSANLGISAPTRLPLGSQSQTRRGIFITRWEIRMVGFEPSEGVDLRR